MVDSWKLNTGIHQDKKTVMLEIEKNGTPQADVIMESPELDDLIKTLAQYRLMMPEPVPESIDPGTRCLATLNPKWDVSLDGWDQGPVLALRHPGYGWMHFGIPDDESPRIADALTRPRPSK